MNNTDYNYTEIRYALRKCTLGLMLVANSSKGICAVSFSDDQKELLLDLQDNFPTGKLIADDAAVEPVAAKIATYVDQPKATYDLSLDICGTAFQKRVWEVLATIPHGKTVTYTDIAKKIGAPKAVRAVANACGANKLAVLIPCHRVVRSDGSLSGYRWGVDRKRVLLEREGVSIKII